MSYSGLSALILLVIGFTLTTPGIAYPCDDDYIQCPSDSTCIPLHVLCNGVKDCSMAEDEDERICAAYRNGCPGGQIRCPESYNYHYGSGSYSSCESFFSQCTDRSCSKHMNQTVCDAFLTRRLPVNPIPLPKNIPRNAISEEDLQTFLALVNSSSILNNSCPMFYTNVSGDCYALLPFKMSWSEAVESCASISGILADFDNLKYVNLVNYLRNKGYSSDFWIGGLFDLVSEEWKWLSGESMPVGTPYWSLTYKRICETRKLSGKLGEAEGCYHYHQTPTESSAGQCAAMDYKNMFYFSNEKCYEEKRPICLYKSH